MKVKICGITSLDDALYAFDAGTDMLGYNFYPPSKRYLDPLDCEMIQVELSNRGLSIRTVAVFVNASFKTIETILDDCGLDLAQLHGDESPKLLEMLGERAFKAIRPHSIEESILQARSYLVRKTPPDLLVDAYHPDQYGGTGLTGDWMLARALADDYSLLLAGGLHPGNVAAAVRQVNPWGVDVASGVEREGQPGKKDPLRMQQFINQTRAAALHAGEQKQEKIIQEGETR